MFEPFEGDEESVWVKSRGLGSDKLSVQIPRSCACSVRGFMNTLSFEYDGTRYVVRPVAQYRVVEQ